MGTTTPDPWPGSGRMLVEMLLVVVAVSVVYVTLGSVDSGPGDPESPETDGESITEFFQLFGAIATFFIAVVLVCVFELGRLIVRARHPRG